MFKKAINSYFKWEVKEKAFSETGIKQCLVKSQMMQHWMDKQKKTSNIQMSDMFQEL